MPHLAFQPDSMSNLPILPMSEVETGYYLRLRVEDKPGVLADITRILADQGISIDALLQREPEEGEGETDIIILTHVCNCLLYTSLGIGEGAVSDRCLAGNQFN